MSFRITPYNIGIDADGNMRVTLYLVNTSDYPVLVHLPDGEPYGRVRLNLEPVASTRPNASDAANVRLGDSPSESTVEGKLYVLLSGEGRDGTMDACAPYYHTFVLATREQIAQLRASGRRNPTPVTATVELEYLEHCSGISNGNASPIATGTFRRLYVPCSIIPTLIGLPSE